MATAGSADEPRSGLEAGIVTHVMCPLSEQRCLEELHGDEVQEPQRRPLPRWLRDPQAILDAFEPAGQRLLVVVVDEPDLLPQVLIPVHDEQDVPKLYVGYAYGMERLAAVLCEARQEILEHRRIHAQWEAKLREALLEAPVPERPVDRRAASRPA